MKRYMVLIGVISAVLLLISAFAWAQGGNPSTLQSGPNLYLSLNQQNEKTPTLEPDGFCPVERFGGLTYEREYGPSAQGDNLAQRWCW
jgi:hypothetical protein